MPAEPILILGGTREARELAAILTARGHDVTSSLAGVTARPELPVGNHRIGGFGGVDGLGNYLATGAFRVVADATHPFAARISRHAADACRRAGIPLLRLERPAWREEPGDSWTHVASPDEAAAALPRGARVLLTTGRKDLAAFFERGDIAGIARMIEPPPLDPPARWQVLRERPPFREADEAALMAAHAITHLVTKNAGGGATDAKLRAARKCRVGVIMIGRPPKPEVPCFPAAEPLADAVERLLSP